MWRDKFSTSDEIVTPESQAPRTEQPRHACSLRCADDTDSQATPHSPDQQGGGMQLGDNPGGLRPRYPTSLAASQAGPDPNSRD
jgi:hypothetical protein